MVATLRDVARVAAVDISTVSRVLRNDPRQSVREETRKRIIAAAQSLDYRPDAIARSLRSGRTRTVALLVPDLDNIGFSQIIRGAQAAAAQHRYLLLLGNPPTSDGDEDLLQFHGRVDGLLVASAHLHDRHLPVLQRQDVPIVLVNRRVAGHVGSVIVDDAAGSRLAMRHLYDHGHRSIAHLAGELDTDTARRKLQAYRQFVTSRSLPHPPRWTVDGRYTIAGGVAAAMRMHEAGVLREVTAVYAANLASALGFVSSLKSLRYRIPKDVSLVAMDDHPFASHTTPPLTTVEMPLFEMGHEAMSMLVGAVDGQQVRNQVIQTPPMLHSRGSVADPG
jgi:DNA-binding LacI/PurR family transcriptional regulator